jgi:hypothetical protein
MGFKEMAPPGCKPPLLGLGRVEENTAVSTHEPLGPSFFSKCNWEEMN